MAFNYFTVDVIEVLPVYFIKRKLDATFESGIKPNYHTSTNIHKHQIWELHRWGTTDRQTADLHM